MESNHAVLGAVIFILMILLANFVMYAIARGAARSDQKGFLEILGKSIHTATKPKDNSMDELRRKVEELEKGKKEQTGDSE